MNPEEEGGAALREARAQLAHGARMAAVGQLTAAIAHDMNQPLMSISSNAGAALRWLHRDPPRLDVLESLLREIVEQSQRAGRSVMSWQALGQVPPSFAAVDLHALIREALALAGDELAHHRIAVDCSLAPAAAWIIADAAQLRLVLDNLLANAVEALAGIDGRPRRLMVSSAREPGWIKVLVRDTGRGLGDLDREAIFEPFIGSRRGRLGLGLAISRAIVEAHGGRITARPGAAHGCELSFTLPLPVPAPKDNQ